MATRTALSQVHCVLPQHTAHVASPQHVPQRSANKRQSWPGSTCGGFTSVGFVDLPPPRRVLLWGREGWEACKPPPGCIAPTKAGILLKTNFCCVKMGQNHIKNFDEFLSHFCHIFDFFFYFKKIKIIKNVQNCQFSSIFTHFVGGNPNPKTGCIGASFESQYRVMEDP